jgi:hypothetical protein
MAADAVSLATRQLAAPNAAASPTPENAEPTVPGANQGWQVEVVEGRGGWEVRGSGT